MKNLSKFIGIIALAAVIMFSMTACKDGDDDDNGWRKWIHRESAVTLDYSVDKDGVCTITVGGTADAYRWRAHVRRSISAQAVNKTYLYKIEAWTDTGERTLTVQYYENNDTEIYLGKGMTIDSTKKTYDILGQEIPGDEPEPGLRFQCADQLGTFYVKVLSITEYTPSLEYEIIDDVDSPNNGTYRLTSGAGMRGAVVIPAVYNNLPVTEIGRDAFSGTSITSVTIPASVTEIGGWAFCDCTNLTSVIFATGSQLEKIGWGAFLNTAITSITIPASVTHISEAVFARCWNLTSITIDSSNLYYSSENGILYNKDKTELRSWPTASGNVTIPSSVTDIGNDAFRACKITSVTIPQIVTYIGSAAFCDCTNIASITIPATVTYINGGAFAYWTASQTINIQGHANHQSTINAGWNDNWYDESCNAVINYLGQ